MNELDLEKGTKNIINGFNILKIIPINNVYGKFYYKIGKDYYDKNNKKVIFKENADEKV